MDEKTQKPQKNLKNQSEAGGLDEGNIPVEAVKTDAKTLSVPETGGPKGLEPTRYGDWERNGKCVDF